MPSFESEPVTQPSPTNARASSPVKNDPIVQPLTLTRDHTSTLFFAGMVALFAIALAVLILGGAVSSAVVPTDVVGVAAVPVPDLPVAKVCACVNMCISVIVDMYMCVCVIVSASVCGVSS